MEFIRKISECFPKNEFELFFNSDDNNRKYYFEVVIKSQDNSKSKTVMEFNLPNADSEYIF